MAYEQKPGDLVLFRNQYKTDGDKKPDYKGKGLDLQGEKVELAAWIKSGEKGPFLSIKMQKPQEKDVPRSSNPASRYAPANETPLKQSAPVDSNSDRDDLPF